MAAATISNKKNLYNSEQEQVQEFLMSVMTADQAEDVTHGGPSGVAPYKVSYEIYTPATTGHIVTLEHHGASDDTSNNTVRLKPRVETGGDITGCVLKVWCHFIARSQNSLNP